MSAVWLQVDSVTAGKVDIEALKLWDSTAPLNFCPVPSRCKQCTQPERPAPMVQLPELTARFIKQVQEPDAAAQKSFNLILTSIWRADECVLGGGAPLLGGWLAVLCRG